MKSISTIVMQKIRLRKIFMTVFSVAFIILICGTLNTIFEDGNENTNSVKITANNENINIADSAIIPKQNPREIHHEKSDKKIRIFGAFVLVVLIFSSVAADFIFVCCPCCSKHISYGTNPLNCRRCGASFTPVEKQK